MSHLNPDDKKLMKICLLMAQEYLYVTVYDIESKKEMTIRSLQNDEELKDFDTLWKELLILLTPITMDKEDQATLDLIVFAYNEFKLSNEFKKMLIVALHQNEKFKLKIKSMPHGIGELFINL